MSAETALDPEVEARLATQVERVREDPARIAALFPAAGREIGRDPRVRRRLLEALAEGWSRRTEGDELAGRLADEVAALYRYGDADERRAVLDGLPALPLGDRAVPLLRDALRSNDPRLVAAALGEYAARELDQEAWRQGVLKCLFMQVPLDAVHDLDRRADDRLRAMVSAFADERRAAGRAVPADADRLLPTPREV